MVCRCFSFNKPVDGYECHVCRGAFAQRQTTVGTLSGSLCGRGVRLHSVADTAEKISGLQYHFTYGNHPLMTFGVFGAKDRGRFLRTLLTIYLILFVMGGVQNSIGVLLGSSTLEILLSGMAAALLFCIYQIRRRVIQQICRVELWAGTEHVTVDAYCDTGNLLRDPLTGRPVCILQQEVLAQFAADRTIQKEISCHTIGTEKEKLKIVMLDKMKIYQKGTVTEIKEPEIGLHTGEIMQNPKVQMLLHAGYIR